MSLVEVIVAMLLLTGVVLGLGGFMAKFSAANAQARLVIAANEIAAMRLDAIRTQSTYSSIALLADSTLVTRDYTNFGMRTRVKRIGGQPADSVDYRIVSVYVTHPGMRKTVTKTTAVAAF
jgi:HAMP domain-containing protein